MNMRFLKQKHFYLAVALLLIITALSGSTGKNSATTAGSEKIVFSEVLYNSRVKGEAQGEWIELYNPQSTTVNIGEWTIHTNAAAFIIPGGTTIGPKAYLIIADGTTYFSKLYGCVPGFSSNTLKLSNNGDYLILKNRSGTTIDQVAWESGGCKIFGWGSPSKPYAWEGKTIRRINPNVDTDTHYDWISNSLPQPDCGGGGTSSLSPESKKLTNIKSSSSAAKKTFTTKKKHKSFSVAVQCSGYTKKGRRCRRKTTDPSGYCWQHR